jgi:hypothetical protein
LPLFQARQKIQAKAGEHGKSERTYAAVGCEEEMEQPEL